MMDLVVNVTENWGIGNQNELLVAISADFKRFRQLTTGRTVILGRKTLATFPGGRPLKNRRNLVLSGNPGYQVEGAASIYELLLPYCSEARVTKTLLTVPADRFFPNLDELPNWHITETSEILEENGICFQYVDYKNDAPLPL